MTPLCKLFDLLCPLRVRYRELQEKYERMSTLFVLANNALSLEQRKAVFRASGEDKPIDLSALPFVIHVDLRTVEPNYDATESSLPHLDASGPSEALKNLTQ